MYRSQVEIRRVFDVHVPPEAAFAYFSDPNRAFERFAPDFVVRWAGPIQPGTMFQIDAPNPADSCDGVVDTYDPPRHLAYRIWVRKAPDRGGVVKIEVEPTRLGASVAAVMETKMSRTMELAAKVMRPWLAFQARRGTRKLVRALEVEYGAAPD
jgi:uncharacterized protein YndB with AHSA1/START domain